MKTTNKRKELFRALTGSHNYNLNILNSDKDYKIFVCPTFNDLYFNKEYSESIISETEDHLFFTIKKLTNLLFNSNIAFIEVLFSEELIIPDDISDKSKELLNKLFEMKDKISRMNLSYLYDSCIGMYKQNIISVKKDKVNYNYKKALQSIRALDFIERFYNTGFNDFKQAIYYNNDDPTRQLLLDIKNGKFSYEEIIELAENKLEQTKKYKQIYKSHKIDNYTKDKLIEIVQSLVKDNLDL